MQQSPFKIFSNFQVMDLNLNENLLVSLSEGLSKAPRLRILRLQNNHLTLNSIPENLLSESKVSQIVSNVYALIIHSRTHNFLYGKNWIIMRDNLVPGGKMHTGKLARAKSKFERKNFQLQFECNVN